MDQFPINAILQEPIVVLFFWVLLSLEAMTWTDLYYFRRKWYSQAELLNLSSNYAGVTTTYNLYGIIGTIVILSAVLICLVLNGKALWIMPVLILGGFGIIRGAFALTKGVYQVGKWYHFVPDSRDRIILIAKLQIGLCTMLICVGTIIFFVGLS